MLKEIKKIFIMNSDSGWHLFGADISKMDIKCFVSCEYCNQHLYPQYVYIIDKLKKAGLLDKDYPILCCRCFKGEIKNANRNIKRKENMH